MSTRRLFPSSTSQHLKDYFEAAGHYRNDRFPETVEAAKLNLTNETTPRSLQIKNYILISAATDDPNEAREARQAAEAIWEDCKARIPADGGPEYDYEREGVEELRKNIDQLDFEEEESDMEDEYYDMDEDEFDDEDEDEEGEDEEESGEFEHGVPVDDSMKGSVEGKSGATDGAFVPGKVESDIEIKHEADIKLEPDFFKPR